MNKIKLYHFRFIKYFTLSLLFTFFFGSNSFTQSIYWSDFNHSTIHQGKLININEERNATALSQNTIHNNSEWLVEYEVAFDKYSSKVLGVIYRDRPISLANMEVGLHFSSSRESTISFFLYGRKKEVIEARSGDILRIKYVDEKLFFELNGDLFYSHSFSMEESYKFAAILEKRASFERMEYTTTYKEIFVTKFDTLTNKGSIQVNLPDDAPTGPYHYLIGNGGYVDLDGIQTMINDSIGYPIDNSFFEPKEHSKSYLFEGLASGNYFVSVLNLDKEVLFKKVVRVRQPLFLGRHPNIHKEGGFFITQNKNTMIDLPVFIDEMTLEVRYEVQIVDLNKDQFFGFGIDTIPLMSKEDIKFGYSVLEGKVSIISGGNIQDQIIEIKENDTLGFLYEDEMLKYVLNNKHIYEVDTKGLGKEILNLKHGVLQEYVILNPIEILVKLKPFNTVRISNNKIECDKELADVNIRLNVYTRNYPILYSHYTVTDASGNVISILTPNTTVTLTGLPPGNYHISGSTTYISSFIGFPYFYSWNTLSLSEDFVVGYPVSWVNKSNLIYTSQDESLKLDLSSNGGSHASSNNEITNNVNWFDFKIKYYQTFIQLLMWSINPESTFANPSDIVLLLKPLNNNSIFLIGPSFNTTFPYNEDDRFKIAYDGVKISFYKNYGAPLFQINATSASFKRLNVFMSSNGYGSEIHDVYTNMDCLQTPIFAKTERQLKGVRYKPINKKVYFYYEEEYFDSDGVLNYRVVNDSRNEVIDGSSQSLINSYGDNRRSIDVSNLPNGAYILEVENDKKELFYLRFIIE